MGARRRGRLHVDGRRADWLRDGALDGRPLLILAHGAGAGCESAPLEDAAQQLVARGLAVARFQFPYMQAARDSGRRRPPDRAAVLLATWSAMLAAARRWRGVERLVLGGRSMCGRMASLLLADGGAPAATGAVYLGYPLSPAGKPHVERAEHLPSVPVPQLFVSGDRDALADLSRLRRVLGAIRRARGAGAARLHVVPGGDHGLAVRGPGAAGRHAAWLDAVAAFVHEVAAC